MKRILYVAALLCAFDFAAFGQGSAPLKVREVDGSPSKSGVTQIVVSNGSLTISGTTATIVTGGGGGGGTVNSGTAKRLAYYPSTGTTVDDVVGFEYDAAANWTLSHTPAAAKTGFLIYEPTSTAPATIAGAPALLQMHVINSTNYWGLGYSSDATTAQWANYLGNFGELTFSSSDDGGGSFNYLGFSLQPTANYGAWFLYPEGLIGTSASTIYYGGLAEAGNNIFGLLLTNNTPTSGAIFPLTWSVDGVQLQPISASAGGTNELRFLELAANGVHYVGFKSPDALSASRVWTLPSADGSSGQVLSTNGSGVLSWASAGGGNIGDTVTGGTAKSVLFVNTGPILAQDNTNFVFDDSTNRVGINNNAPGAALSIGTTGTGNRIWLYDDGAGNARGFGIQSGLLEIFAPTTQIGTGTSGSLTVTGSFTSTGLFLGGAATSTDAQLQVHSGATNRPALQIRGADTHVTDVMLVREKIGGNEWTRQKVDTNFDWVEQTRNGAQSLFGTLSEEKTLSTSGATSDTTIQLPANSIILGVTARVTTTISGVDSTTLQVGDATTAARFGSGSTLTAGATIVGLSHMQGGITTDATGPVQTSAAAVRLTLTGGADNTPSAGAVRVTIHYIQLVAPTS